MTSNFAATTRRTSTPRKERRVQAKTIRRLLAKVRAAAQSGSAEELSRLEQSIASSLGAIVF